MYFNGDILITCPHFFIIILVFRCLKQMFALVGFPEGFPVMRFCKILIKRILLQIFLFKIVIIAKYIYIFVKQK
jgi:hypothetical protein